MILDGTKTIESRLTRNARPPFGRLCPGDRIHFKRSAGPFFAEADVKQVLCVEIHQPTEIDRLAKQYNKHIGAPAEYWQSKRDTARYVTLAWLINVTPSTAEPAYQKRHMTAWYVLDDDPA